jgi:starch-binding outer membrane protein, SusD/RagB family
MRNVIRETRCMGLARRGFLILAALSTSILGSSCSDIFSLKQENPGQLTDNAVYTPGNALLMVNGAISDFECAFTRYVVASGAMGDELTDALQNTELYDLDRRTVTPNSTYAGGCNTAQNPGIYTSLSTARGTADVAYDKLNGWTDEQVPNRARLMGQAAAYAGMSLVLLGEGMCSAAINVGPEMTPAQLFAEAVIRFDRAITAATSANDANTLNLAKLGKARALISSGNAATAAVEAAAIPTSFVLVTSADLVFGRRQNMVFVHTVLNSWSSVDPSFRGLLLADAPDPRVLVRNSGRVGSARNTPVWTADKYPAANTPTIVAKYAEAQLIIAEARVAANDFAGAATAINNARNSSGRTGVPAYSATDQTAAQVLAQIIEERRREFFLEGHRFGDVRRFNLPLVPAPNTEYFQGGGLYGDQRCFPLPNVERANNPNIS